MSTGYRLAEGVCLQGRNTFRAISHAEVMADVHDAGALPALFSQPWVQMAPLLVLGEGSNLLLAGDVPGLTLCLTAARVSMENHGVHARVRADAGVSWNDLVRWSLAHGLCGLENLVSIPGTVGACPIQNIGAYGVEVAEFIDTVEAFDRESLRMSILDVGSCRFGYRDSVFKRETGRWIITAVTFRLSRSRELQLEYAGVREELAAMGVEDRPRHSEVAEAIARLRARKLPDPAVVGNAGSFFKNPVLPLEQAEHLRAANPGLPIFPGHDAGSRKLSAAWLIEACGWKGRRIGDAGIAAQHALVLVNHGKATGEELLACAEQVASDVAARFGVALEPEPRIIGRPFRAASPT